MSNALDAFVETCAIARIVEGALVLVGQGPEKARLEAKARERGGDQHRLPAAGGQKGSSRGPGENGRPVPRLESPPLYRYGISPNKLMDYMLAGKPVIHAVEAGNDPVAEAQCGISCEPENPQAIAESVIELITRRTAEERLVMGHRGRDYVVRHFSYTTLARQFLDVMGGAGKRSGSPCCKTAALRQSQE